MSEPAAAAGIEAFAISPGRWINVAHTSWVESVAFSPDGELIASASLDGTVKIWKAPPATGVDWGN